MPDPPQKDIDIRARAVYDQVQAILRDMAPVLWRYYECLRAEGFNEEQAMAMVLVAQIRMSGGMEEFLRFHD